MLSYLRFQTLLKSLTSSAGTVARYRGSITGADPGFFLGGGALVSCSTSTPINHIVFFCRIPVVLENRRSSRGGGGGGAPPRSAPDKVTRSNVRNSCWSRRKLPLSLMCTEAPSPGASVHRFTGDGVGVGIAGGDVRALRTLWKSRIGVASGVISLKESVQ